MKPYLTQFFEGKGR